MSAFSGKTLQVRDTDNSNLQLQYSEKEQVAELVHVVKNSLQSPSSKRAYGMALEDFLDWWKRERPAEPFNKSLVQEHKEYLIKAGIGSINLRLSAIRKLAGEAADNGWLPENIAMGIKRAQGLKEEGKRVGNWLTLEQAQELILLPNTATIQGLRDRAILAVFLGAGLRRAEVSALKFEHIQKREGRWVILDMLGKRNKKRSVPIANWVKLAISQYTKQAHIEGGLLFRFIHKSKTEKYNLALGERGLSAQALYLIVLGYAEKLATLHNIEVVKPHDLRRSFAKLAYKSQVSIEQISLSLGHESIEVTKNYIGIEQEFEYGFAPSDKLGLHLL